MKNLDSHPVATPPCLPEAARFLVWPIRGDLAFLNHGSFGSVPEPIREAYNAHRKRIESDPIEWIGRRAESCTMEVCNALGSFVDCDPAGIGLVTNATSGVGSVLRSLPLRAGDRLVTTDHVYNAVRMAMTHRARATGAVYEEVPIVMGPRLPLSLDPLASAIATGDPPALVVLDHVTSATGAVLRIEPIIQLCRTRGVPILIDGAHAPGMLPLSIRALDADWYTGNLHKWVCAPKGCGFLFAHERVREMTHPESISHLLDQGFWKEFSWQGTRDLAAWWTIPDALALWESIGWRAIREHNSALCTWGQSVIESAWKVEPLLARSTLNQGSMAIISLPSAIQQQWATPELLMSHLHDQHLVEVPVIPWQGKWHVRISAHLHNKPSDYERLARAIADSLS
ncbi:MAG: aminotransferase class V-fold PLP-dependent enzyme [Planctomycetota bacterium]|nr:aminotransferase class V-fold PLP-dependent enzyme [Planctomycetota bacterium]